MELINQMDNNYVQTLIRLYKKLKDRLMNLCVPVLVIIISNNNDKKNDKAKQNRVIIWNR